MKTLMILPLLFGAPNEAAPTPATAIAATEAGYAELVAEFDEAVSQYKAAYKAEKDKKKWMFAAGLFLEHVIVSSIY